MAEVLLLHHAQGLTAGVLDLAGTLRAAGHTVHTPDLFEGQTFDSLDAGINYASETGFGEIIERGVRSADLLPAELVYVGLSLGVMPAQRLAQTRPGARGALLLHACLPVSEFGEYWPDSVPVQIHAMDADPYFTDDGDIDAARALSDSTESAELFLYPGQAHLFTDNSLPAFDAEAARAVTQRMLKFLASTAPAATSSTADRM